MTTQQQSILYALEQLRRSPWPAGVAEFGDTPPTIPSDIDPDAIRRSIEATTLSADRWTCRVSPELLRTHLTTSNSAPILIHAIDADLAVPLLAHWAMRHRELLLWLVAQLRAFSKSDVRLVLPNDLPGTWRKEFKRAPVEWVEPKYPAGHWRMLPHVLGLQKRRPLVLDAVAAVDLARSILGQSLDEHPISICDLDRAEPLVFKLASRDEKLGDLLKFDTYTHWIAGPRWRRREISADQILDDNELVFFAHREPHGKQSPCIRCGWCEYICPTRCSPAEFLRAQREHDQARAERAGLGSCIDCGLCTNVCPSNLPLQLFIDRLRCAKEEA